MHPPCRNETTYRREGGKKEKENVWEFLAQQEIHLSQEERLWGSGGRPLAGVSICPILFCLSARLLFILLPHFP